MNKWQIILPITAFAVVFLAIGITHELGERDYAIRLMTASVGHELVTSTNSSHLTGGGADLQAQLYKLHTSPVGISTVLLGDEPSPIGDGSACSRLTLTNEVGQGLLIRLQQTDHPATFRVLSFRSISQ